MKSDKRHPSYSENDFLLHLDNALSYYTTTDENITLIGDFNMDPDKNKFLSYFSEIFNVKNLLNEPKCFKSQNTTMIDLILTNHRSGFMNATVLETCTSDHHKIIFSTLKHTLGKGPPNTVCYRDLKNLDQKPFNSYLWNPKYRCVRIPLKSFCKSFKTLYNYLLL